MNLYIGNLAREVTQDDLLQVFGAFGQVVCATIIKDIFSGEPRGFGFVEMSAKAEAEAAMNGVREIKGRMVTINEARPREPRHRGGRERRGGWR